MAQQPVLTDDTIPQIPLVEEGGITGLLGAANASAKEDNDLMPKRGGVLSEPATYRSLFLLETLDTPLAANQKPRELNPLTEPIDPFDDSKLQDADLKPAVGVLTVHEQRWEQKGLALGNLLQSICLAPGEVTQVAVVDWKRKTEAAGTELTEQGEEVTSRAEQDRAVNEVQRAVAQESQWGTSSTSASSVSSQTGASGGFLWFGGSASRAATTSSVLTAQFSAGNRNIAGESTNNISQRTAEHSQALRSRRQSVIREVSEQEAESLSTRVLANYNRRHTLNILFFEVLQLYQIHTRLKRWERCLFVPMKPIDFVKDKTAIETHRAELLNIFLDLRADENTIRLLDYSVPDSQLATLEQKIREITEIKNLEAEAQRLKPGSVEQEQKLSKAAPLKLKYKREIVNARPRFECDEDLALIENPDNLDQVISAAQRELEAAKVLSKISAEQQLNTHRLFLSQQLWLRMSPYRIFRILQNYKITAPVAGASATPEPPKQLPLSMLVDPQPVGIFGNYLAFRWGFNDDKDRSAFKEKYFQKLEEAQQNKLGLNLASPADTTAYEMEDVIGLPTTGVFAEAVLGRSVAAEKVDESYGKWNDKDNMIPILPPKIADLQSRDRHHDIDLKAQDFTTSLAQLRAQSLADISHIDKVLAAVGKGDTFRDMGGLAQAVSLAAKLGELSAAGAKDAAEQARKLQEKIMDTFSHVLDSEAGKAVVSEYMVPGSGALLHKNGGEKERAATGDAKPKAETAPPKAKIPA